MAAGEVTVVDALRLGWAVAEVRGRHWPQGPRPHATPLPLRPDLVLPLRSQRVGSASRQEAVASLVHLVGRMGLDRDATFEAELRAALSPWPGEAGDPPRTGGTATEEDPWRPAGTFFLNWDAWFQDELSRRLESLANGYLLGRGLAECYWGLGPEDQWELDSAVSAVSLPFLLGDDRRRELSRMLGRLEPGVAHEMTPPAVAGSLEAWGTVATDPRWARDSAMRDNLYEQVRRWYQLLVLGQDPTTLIRPYARLRHPANVIRAARIFWPQIALALVSIALVTAYFSVVGSAGDSGAVPVWFSSLLATGGFGAFAAAGLLAKGKSAAQRLVTRLRQDAYTDLVAVSVTTVPPPPAPAGGDGRRQLRHRVESAVRRRTLTPPTPPPT
ncbi:MAG: hypothetical protein ACJ711_09280 [Ornithinibacter sp.]